MVNIKHLIVGTIFLMCTQLAAFSQQITFEKNNYDFGQVGLNSEPERFLKFKNTGADTLIITSAPTTACGCDMATIKDKKMIYAPGEMGTLIYTFDTKSARKYDNIITIQTNGDPAFTAIRVKWEVLVQGTPNLLIRENPYVYNNQKDTIYLSKIDAGLFCSCDELKIKDSIQIDGVGLKEIVFFRNCHGSIVDHGGTFENTGSVKISKYEIWNLDSKRLIFEATSFYKSDYERNQIHKDPQRTKGKESWSYDFKIDSSGLVTISNVKTRTKAYKFAVNTEKSKAKNKLILIKSGYDYNFMSDKIEGTYRYINGIYIRE